MVIGRFGGRGLTHAKNKSCCSKRCRSCPDRSIRIGYTRKSILGTKEVERIELHDELREIEYCAFYQCTALKELRLSDGVESIGNFTEFRIPPLVTTLHLHVLGDCQNMFSLELIENIIRVQYQAFGSCYSLLRNIALASNTAVERGAFGYCFDLLHIFGTEEAIVDALRNRFAELPVHSKMYYKSYYNQMTLEDILHTIAFGENGELDPTGLQQDCFGMTPLHIMACSTVQQLELCISTVG